MGNAERDITQILVLLIVAAIIANLITHGQVTTALARSVLTFLNSGLRIAAGQSAGTVS